MEVRHQFRQTESDLTNAFLADDSRSHGLYDYRASGDGFAFARAQELDRLFPEERRRRLVSALRRYSQEVTGLSQEVEGLLDKLADPRCLAVVTGQQAGLFTGPLYSVYKAVSVVQQARHFESVLQRPVVPVFWVATEDHDFEEVSSAWYVGQDGRVNRSHLHYRPAARTPVGLHAIAPEEFHRLISELSSHLPNGVAKDDLLYEIDDAYHQTGNMGDFFARLLSVWMRDAPLLVLNPMRTDLRVLVREAFSLPLERPREFIEAAREGAKAVSERGFTPQVEVQKNHTLLYLLDDGKRYALDTGEREGEFLLRDARKTLTRDEAFHRLEEHPEHFSSGVLYRPVVQDYLLPVLAYVGGPAEIAYHGMIRGVFRAAGRKVPPLLLRRRAVAVPGQIGRILLRYGLTLEDALTRNLLEDFAGLNAEPELNEAIESLREDLIAALRKKEDYFSQLDETLAAALERTERALNQTADRLRGRAIRAWRRKNFELTRSMETVGAWLRPREREQERVLSPLSLIAKYGHGWIGEMAEGPVPPWDQVTFLRW